MLTRPLPLPSERADAARNREILLTTARRLLERRGVDGLTMDAVAREAGLGKGTIFRRFGSRGGLMQALINEIELDFQRQLISGPPPLGPGAAPIDRLVAFGRERIRLITRQGDLIRAAEEPPETRYTSPPRAALHLHLRVLLKQSDFEGDTQVLAFTLLAALDAALVLHEHREANISLDRLANGWEELIRQVVAPVPSGHARPGGEALAEPV